MRTAGPRLGPMVTLSALAHVVVLGYALAAVWQPPRLVYRPPAYTVDLVDAPPAAARALPPPVPAPAPPPAAAPPAPAPARPAPPPAPSRAEMAALERQKAEAERQQLAELERQRQAEAERQRLAEEERRRQAEVEKQKAAEAERTARLSRLQEERARIQAEEARRQEAARVEQERAERLARVRAEQERVREVQAQAQAAGAARLRQEQFEIKFKDYKVKAAAQIRSYWILPEWARGRNVEVPVMVRVARDGRVLAIKIERRSGDPRLDQTVENALEKARQAGLPPLPDEYSKDELEMYFVFNPTDT